MSQVVPHHDLRRTEVNATIALLVLAFAAVALRVFARYKSEMRFGPDDYFIIAAFLAILPFGIANFVGYMGKHMEDIPNRARFVETFVCMVVSYAISTMLTKISILYFYCRIFSNQKLKHVAICVGTLAVMYNIVMITVASTMCVPLSSMWTGKPGKCINVYVPFTVCGITNFITDLVILAIPVHFVLRLQANLLKKIQIAGIFLTGIVVCAFGITRVTTDLRANSQPDREDTSYNHAIPTIWSLCEACVGIVAACLPTLGFYFAQTIRFNRESRFWLTCTRLKRASRVGTSMKKVTQDSSSDVPDTRRMSGKTLMSDSAESTIQKTIDVNISTFPMDRELASIDRMTISSARCWAPDQRNMTTIGE